MEDSEAVLFCCFKVKRSSSGCGSPWQMSLEDKIILLMHFFILKNKTVYGQSVTLNMGIWEWGQKPGRAAGILTQEIC